MKKTFVIVGAAHTGGMAAETLRKEGFDGRIILIGSEKHRPYIRPPLSKDYLRGEEELKTVYLQADEDFYDKHKIELRLNTKVNDIDPAAQKLSLDNGETLAYDKLVLATGAVVRHLELPGSRLAGIHYLRTVEDSDTIKKAAKHNSKAVIIGSSWIGTEVAASLRQLGLSVSVITNTSVPYEKILGKQVGQIYRDLHESYGVKFIQKDVVSFRGKDSVTGIEFSDGQTIDSKLVVAGIGIMPNTELAESAGLKIDNGIVCNEFFETSAPNIYAAGDVANVFHPFYKRQIRVEHWANAQNQGKAVAKNMLGQREAYERIPYFYSDQYDTSMEYSGFNQADDEVIFRGDVAKRKFAAFWCRDGKMTAGMLLNYDKLKIETIQNTIRSERIFKPVELSVEESKLEAGKD